MSKDDPIPFYELTEQQFQAIKEKTRLEERGKTKFVPTLLRRYVMIHRLKILDGSFQGYIKIYVSIAGHDPNNIGRSFYAWLSPDQVFKIWESRPNSVSIELKAFDAAILVSLNANDLIVDRQEADTYLSLSIEDEGEEISDDELGKRRWNNPKERDEALLKQSKIILKEKPGITKTDFIKELLIFARQNKCKITSSRLSRIIPFKELKNQISEEAS